MFGVITVIALQGFYEDGMLRLFDPSPVKRSNVLVIFPEEELSDKNNIPDDDLAFFRELTGSIKHNINPEAELMEALDEKNEGAY